VPAGFWRFAVAHQRESNVFSRSLKPRDFLWVATKKRLLPAAE
jgi:hypothetical protein